MEQSIVAQEQDRPPHWGFTVAFRELIAGENETDVANKLGYTGARIGQIRRGERPSRNFVQKVVEVYNLDPREWFLKAAQLPPPGTDTPDLGADTGSDTTALAQRVEEISRKLDQVLRGEIDPLAQLRAQFPRVRDYMWARFGAVADLCESLKLPAPEVPRFCGSSESLTHEQVDQEIEELLEELRQEHPEFAERLKLEG